MQWLGSEKKGNMSQCVKKSIRKYFYQYDWAVEPCEIVIILVVLGTVGILLHAVIFHICHSGIKPRIKMAQGNRDHLWDFWFKLVYLNFRYIISIYYISWVYILYINMSLIVIFQ